MLKNLSGLPIALTLLLASGGAGASVKRAAELYKRGGGGQNYLEVAEQLGTDGLYLAAVPFIKEYMAGGAVSKGALDQVIDDIIVHVGVKQFEVFPEDILARVNTPMMKYIRAKRAFRKGNYTQASNELGGGLPDKHPARAFALNLEATIKSIGGNTQGAINDYEECVAVSASAARSASDSEGKRQLEINRDYCVVGKARAQFAAKSYGDAYSSFLDLPKSSPIWPEILFEEAWNSFYMRDFNRTLGKLVTYKAPVFDYVFNPEIDVLRSLTYMELCLWDDATQVVNDFYGRYEKEAQSLRAFISKNGSDYQSYYLMAKGYREGRFRDQGLLSNFLSSITKDATYMELNAQFATGHGELEKIKGIGDVGFRKVLARNLKETLLLQRDLIGSYVKRRMQTFQAQMDKGFEGMSYIKLDILDQRKGELYGRKADGSRNRGDILNLQRTEKQYFWTFNGEFWADELGDHVFGLKSECKS